MRPVAEERQEAVGPRQGEPVEVPHRPRRLQWQQQRHRLKEEPAQQQEEDQLARRRLLAEH